MIHLKNFKEMNESFLNESEERNIILSGSERSLIIGMLNMKIRIMEKGTSRYSPGSGLGQRLVAMKKLKEKLL